MKLKNKETGEIVDLLEGDLRGIRCGEQIVVKPVAALDKEYVYNSLAELCEKWEDAPEKPKEYWYVGYKNIVRNAERAFHSDYADNDITEKRKEIGNYFETEEEAKKAVEKLKAWKRLKDNGFGFGRCTRNHTGTYRILLKREIPYSNYGGIEKDLDTIFGGEE